MQELISPAQADAFVLVAAFAVLVGGVIWGRARAGAPGALVGFLGPLLYVLWRVHKYLTRYDPRTGYFGLESLWLLLAEIVFFVLLGLALPRLWDLLTRATPTQMTSEGVTEPPTRK